MTDPVILLGTQSNGETLPVQVNSSGQLVAEGLQGPKGEDGAQGPPGGAFPLPDDPYEGALLGWLNGELAWVGTPPVPIPDDLFGPIFELAPNAITVEGDIPAEIGTGVYVWQVDATGAKYSKNFNVSLPFVDKMVGNYPITDAIYGFDGDLDTYCIAWDQIFNQIPPKGYYELSLDFSDAPLTGPVEIYSGMAPQDPYLGRFVVDKGSGPGSDIPCVQNGWVKVVNEGEVLHRLWIRSNWNGAAFKAIRSQGTIWLDPSLSANFRVQQVAGNVLVGQENDINKFLVGKYLRTFEQRVAPWVLSGVDPTSDIDLLRNT